VQRTTHLRARTSAYALSLLPLPPSHTRTHKDSKRMWEKDIEERKNKIRKEKPTVNSMHNDGIRGELNFCESAACWFIQPLIVFRMVCFRQSRRGAAERNAM